MASFSSIKSAVVDVVDDFTRKDVSVNYKPKGDGSFTAKTKLASLWINEPILATMPIRFNKVLSKVCGSAWNDVGTLDLVSATTIGSLITLACEKSGTKIPVGEPA